MTGGGGLGGGGQHAARRRGGDDRWMERKTGRWMTGGGLEGRQGGGGWQLGGEGG